MRTKNILILSVVLAFCLSANVYAVTDSTGDTAGPDVATVDIESAVVELYGVVAAPSAQTAVEIDLQMAPGSTLPGIVLLEVDLDGDPLTGGTRGMPGLFSSCSGGTAYKTWPGFDIVIAILARDQGPAASTQWCLGVQCASKGDPCTCNESPDCYRADGPCTDPADCYELDTLCTGCGGAPGCFLMNTSTACDPDSPACPITDRVQGEWFVTDAPEQNRLERGRILMPDVKPGGFASSPDSDCYVLPWTKIVAAAQRAGKVYIPGAAQWQVSTWWDWRDGVNGPGNQIDDFVDVEQVVPCCNVTDVVPSTGVEPLTSKATPVCADVNKSGRTDLDDLGIMKSQFFASGCPGCKLDTYDE